MAVDGGQVSFYVNDKYMGVAFENETVLDSTKVFGFVHMMSPKDKVAIGCGTSTPSL